MKVVVKQWLVYENDGCETVWVFALRYCDKQQRDWLVLSLNRISHVLTADQSPDLHLQKEGKLSVLLLNLTCQMWPLQNLFAYRPFSSL